MVLTIARPSPKVKKKFDFSEKVELLNYA